MSKDFEIIITGGGPAGSSAALYLRKLGFSVCIIEKKAFPRETLCGEFLSVEVIRSLKELELFDNFLELHPNEIHSFRFFDKNGKSIFSKFSFTAFGLKRSTFDNFLLQAAKNAGAEVMQPYEVKSILRYNSKFILDIEDIKGSIETISSGIVICAYGKQNLLDKELNRGFINYKSNLNGVKFHLDSSLLTNFNPDEIHIYTSDGIYCGVNAVNDDSITFCFLQDRTASRESPGEQIRILMRENKAFANIFDSCAPEFLNRLRVYGTGNIFFGKKERAAGDIYFTGDAAGVIAPLAGDGIGMAFESSKLLSEILASVKAGVLTKEKALQKYQADWDSIFKKRLKTSLLIQKIILNKFLRSPGFTAARFFPGIIQKAVRSTRNIY